MSAVLRFVPIHFKQKNICQQRNVTFFYNRVCSDYVILLVTFFVANQMAPHNISRTKILINRSGKPLSCFPYPWQSSKCYCRTMNATE